MRRRLRCDRLTEQDHGVHDIPLDDSRCRRRVPARHPTHRARRFTVKAVSILTGGAAHAPACACLALSAALAPAVGAADVQLDRVVVTGTRSEKRPDESAVPVEVVTREELARVHARTLRDALENVPGLQLREIHGKSGYELSLQGLSSDQVLVLIDGLPITASTSSTVDLGQYLLTDVERIEVVKGAASAQHGSSAMGGVINVITRRIDSGWRGHAMVDAGSYGSQSASGGKWSPAVRHGQAVVEGGSQAWRLRVAADVNDDRGHSTEPRGWARQGDAVRREQAGVRLSWLPARAGAFWVDAGTYREHNEKRYDYYVPPVEVPQRKAEAIERHRLAGGGHWRFDNGVRAELKAMHERYDAATLSFSNQALVVARASAQRTEHLGVQFDLPAWRNQLWQFGADLHREALGQTVNGVSELAGNGRVTRRARELYAQNDVVFNDDWELVLGVRWQDDSDFGAHVAPKVSVRTHVLRGDEWTAVLRASLGQGYRVPNLKERYYVFDHSALGYRVIGNPDLQPESSASLQLGGSLTRNDGVSLQANAFVNRVRDLIQTDLTHPSVVDGVAAYTYRNVARARTHGVETAVQWPVTRALQLQAAWTFTHTEDLDTGVELTRRPRHQLRMGADWTWRAGTTLTTRVRGQSSERVDTSSTVRSPSWTTLDLKLNHTVSRGMTLFAGIDNVFGRQRHFADANDFSPATGRFIYLGARFVLGAQP